ncbi:hypothetical protein HK103_004631 [Boothiomyces macroporosus]|uniref:Uncharacterized protein n=1 Tax=Boothiomyces macroporosus TaxID=261099 RepID=A0AAD5ULS1_9FUNG|nr:hypothetical protein HK103_004631 [Boothiomyces macroporosus]
MEELDVDTESSATLKSETNHLNTADTEKMMDIPEPKPQIEIPKVNNSVERDVAFMAFGPKGWFMLLTDGTTTWENIPPELHNKLYRRPKTLPPIQSLAISSDNSWVLIFKDGSFATSGFPMPMKMREALMDEDPAKFIFAPAGGWLVLQQNGTMCWERLPSTLDQLLRRRTIYDPPIDQIAISAFGGWFVRFADGECEWEAIPNQLQKLLISRIRHADPNIVIALSPSDGQSYFACMGDVSEWVIDGNNFKIVFEHAVQGTGEIPESVTWNLSLSPSPSVEFHDCD